TGKLDYLHRLGVDAIYLSPVNSTPEAEFGYAVTDYVGLRRDFGSKRAFHRLVREAHRRGIRVLMDFVPNHTSIHHPYFQDAAQRGRASPTWDYYERDATGAPTHYFDWEHLPNLDYDNPKVRAMIIDAFSYWVRELDVDGFRIDAAWGIQQRAPDFYRELARTLRRIKPDLALIAEASARDGAYRAAGFDAAYDWTESLGQWAWDGVFDREDGRVARLHAALTAGDDPGGAFRFLNNNDTGTRFVTKHGAGLTRAAAGLLLTLPGVPLVYTGDDVGAEFRPYEDGARVISFADGKRLREHYRSLIALRKRLPALRSEHWQPLAFDPAGTWYAYLRMARRGGRPVLVVVNLGGAPTTASIELDRDAPRALVDELAGEEVAVGGGRTIRVPLAGHGLRVMTGLPAPGRARGAP
ncbi:MAG TPA: alpha-amylase family glycosyl hydrolase, partial [Kofleriaceae bacterium]|nr:alpha-amylase family glycosyl hydrolase [Kofleriaceae bacterium]